MIIRLRLGKWLSLAKIHQKYIIYLDVNLTKAVSHLDMTVGVLMA